MMSAFTDLLEAPVPAWMQHPGWRWERVLRYNFGGDALLLRDPFVNAMSPIYRSTGTPYERALCATRSEAYQAYQLNARASHHCGAKWQVEAMIMAGASNDDINTRLPMPGGPEVYEFYRRTYFDVTDYLYSQHCMLSAVLGYSAGTGDEFADCDITWKMLGYTLGLEALDELLWHLAGKPLPRYIKEFIADFKQSRALYYSYHVVQDARLCFKEQLLPLLNLLDSMGNGPKQAAEKDAEGNSNTSEAKRFEGAVREILGNVEYTLRNRNAAELAAWPQGVSQRLQLQASTVHA